MDRIRQPSSFECSDCGFRMAYAPRDERDVADPVCPHHGPERAKDMRPDGVIYVVELPWKTVWTYTYDAAVQHATGMTLDRLQEAQAAEAAGDPIEGIQHKTAEELESRISVIGTPIHPDNKIRNGTPVEKWRRGD